MIALILAGLLQAAQPAAPAAAAESVKPADITNAVDANGVPSWAKRKRKQSVQACETKPNIGVETWRGEYDRNNAGRPKLRNAPATCR